MYALVATEKCSSCKRNTSHINLHLSRKISTCNYIKCSPCGKLKSTTYIIITITTYIIMQLHSFAFMYDQAQLHIYLVYVAQYISYVRRLYEQCRYTYVRRYIINITTYVLKFYIRSQLRISYVCILQLGNGKCIKLISFSICSSICICTISKILYLQLQNICNKGTLDQVRTLNAA